MKKLFFQHVVLFLDKHCSIKLSVVQLLIWDKKNSLKLLLPKIFVKKRN